MTMFVNLLVTSTTHSVKLSPSNIDSLLKPWMVVDDSIRCIATVAPQLALGCAQRSFVYVAQCQAQASVQIRAIDASPQVANVIVEHVRRGNARGGQRQGACKPRQFHRRTGKPRWGEGQHSISPEHRGIGTRPQCFKRRRSDRRLGGDFCGTP